MNVPVDDVLALQVVERQGHLTEVQLDGILAELDALLQVVAQISSQQEVHHHEHVLLILERVPGTRGRTQCSLTVQRGKKTHAAQTMAEHANSKHIQYRGLYALACSTHSTLHVQSLHGKHLQTHMHVYTNVVEGHMPYSCTCLSYT